VGGRIAAVGNIGYLIATGDISAEVQAGGSIGVAVAGGTMVVPQR
jgi:hypothetical protein